MISTSIARMYRRTPLSQIVVSSLVLLALVTAFALGRFGKFAYAHYVEGAVIAGMGIWRIFTEKERYQRFRVAFIVTGVVAAWFVLPGLGLLGVLPKGAAEFFPAIHKVGSLAFFAFLVPVILFGRGADCGWFCPCVATRETAGYIYRDTTPRGKFWWHLRHLKWPATIVALLFIPVSLFGKGIFGDWWARVEGPFHVYIFYGYFGSYLLLPLLGNRNFCRFGCPYGAIWGLVGKFGFFRIKAKNDDCIGCKKCEKVCDMGIPLSSWTGEKPTIRNIECMGCGRCVQTCPNGVLDIADVRGIRKIPKRA